MKFDYDVIEFGFEVDVWLQCFQIDILVWVGVFYNLIMLLIFYLIVKLVDELLCGYFGEDKMLVYVKIVQCEEICCGISVVKYQYEVGLDLGDIFKEMVVGECVLKVGGYVNIMNQFVVEQ